MATDPPTFPPTFLQLARELRDQIYDNALLFTTTGTPPQSIPPHLVDASNPPSTFCTLRWRILSSRGSCSGLMYSCRQVYTEMLESIDRHGGVSFELDLAVIKTPSLSLSLALDNVNSWKRIRQDAEEIWAEWVVLPICTYVIPDVQPFPSRPENPSSLSFTKSKCRNMRVSFRIQSETRFWWWGTIGPGPLTKQLCNMIARFLLHGPLGLPKDSTSSPKSDSSSCSSSRWSIDTLSIEIISGIVTTYTNPYNGQSFTVPSRVVEDAERGMEEHLIGTMCSSGALSGRIRVVRLLVDGKVKRECVVDPEKKFPPGEKSDWALYGCHWVIE